MRASELTVENLADYLRIEPEDITDTETEMLTAFLAAAVEYVTTYTGLTAEECDAHPDLAVAVLCVAGDMYTNRDMYTSLKGTGTAAINRTAEVILNKYAVNLVPKEESDVSA